MKKVLFVATVVKTHIMEFHIPYLKMFKQYGWETAVAARNDYDDKQKCIIPYCDTFYNLPFERNPLKVENTKVYKKLKKIIEEGQFSIIHCHTPVGAMLTRLAARNVRKDGTQVIYTAHGFHFYTGAPILNWLLYYPVEYILSYLTDILITINREDYNRATKFKAGRICYVPGVGVEEIKLLADGSARKRLCCEFGFPDDAFIIVTVGELIKRKNQITLIKAIEKSDDLNIYCLICGSGELWNQLNRYVMNKNLQKRIKFSGYRNDIISILQGADVFVFPSLQEGLPVAVMEAMECGKAIIASKIRGNIDLIEDGTNGFLIDSRDEDKFLEKIIFLERNQDIRENMGDNSIQKIKKFEISKVMDKMKKIYGLN